MILILTACSEKQAVYGNESVTQVFQELEPRLPTASHWDTGETQAGIAVYRKLFYDLCLHLASCLPPLAQEARPVNASLD